MHLLPVSLPTLPPLQVGQRRYLSLWTSRQIKACPDMKPLRSQELHQEGKEQIFQLCLSSLHFKGCAWVWERTKRVCQSTCKTSHFFCPNYWAVAQGLSTRRHSPLPTKLLPVSVTQAPLLFHPICQTVYMSYKTHFKKLNTQCSERGRASKPG